nr:hypothetical protein [Nitrosomonas ureae]
MMTAKAIEDRYDIEFEQIGCDEDHVHILRTLHGQSQFQVRLMI